MKGGLSFEGMVWSTIAFLPIKLVTIEPVAAL